MLLGDRLFSENLHYFYFCDRLTTIVIMEVEKDPVQEVEKDPVQEVEKDPRAVEVGGAPKDPNAARKAKEAAVVETFRTRLDPLSRNLDKPTDTEHRCRRPQPVLVMSQPTLHVDRICSVSLYLLGQLLTET
jgi:hypothetical protein